MASSYSELARSRSPPPTNGVPSRISRAGSIASSLPSSVGFMSASLAVSPEAAFIAATSASRIITSHHECHANTWFDEHGYEPSREIALVSPAALRLVNSFLDQLLFNFILVSRSTSLSALKLAVTEVLKPKLAKEAISQAEEELREYLGGAEPEDGPANTEPLSSREWDPELIWKRTRLRCMVYSSLGDMEEGDEDYHVSQEQLDDGLDTRLSCIVAPHVAIFLTSLLEYMGEQTLIVAAQASYHRMRAKHEKDVQAGRRSVEAVDRTVVEELDIERVALDRTLGRLWRVWKKKIRSPKFAGPESSLARHVRDTPSTPTLFYPGHTSTMNNCPWVESGPPPTLLEPAYELSAEQGGASEEAPGDLNPADAARIPLPMNVTDVAEIQFPGLISYSDDEEDHGHQHTRHSRRRRRPKSLIASNGSALPNLVADLPIRPRSRPSSLPPPAASHTLLATISSDFYPTPPARSLPEESKTTQPLTLVAELVGDSPEALRRPRRSTTVDAKSFRALPPLPGKSSSTTEDSDDSEVAYEDPRIMTSSVVHVSGRTSEQSNREPIETQHPSSIMPIRTSSIRSARLVDVMAPRSPVSPLLPGTNSGPRTPEKRRSTASSAFGGRPRTDLDSSRGSSPRRVETKPSHQDRDSAAMKARNAEAAVSDYRDFAQLALSETRASPTIVSVPKPKTLMVEQAQSVSEHLASALVTELSPSSTSIGRPEPPQKSPRHLNRIDALPITQPAPQPALAKTPSKRKGWPQPPPQVEPASSSAQSSPKTIPRSRSRRGSSLTTRQVLISDSSSSASKDAPVRSAESVARDFENLIQSNETIQFTLTPEGMREPIRNQSPNAKENSSSLYNRNSDESRRTAPDRSPPIMKDNDPRRSTSVSRTPPMSLRVNGYAARGPIPRSVPPMPSRNSGNGPQARDARLVRESLADFAEFIRSTGPQEHEPRNIRRESQSSAMRRSMNGSYTSSTTPSTKPRIRLQARDASTTKCSDNTLDLIDVLRSGPPGESGLSRPAQVGRSQVGATRISQSTNMTESSIPSIPPSINSQSGLLDYRNKPLPHVNGPAASLDTEMMMPKRKTHRVRDPYALGFSDDDNDDDDDLMTTASSGQAPQHEESLAEFLRSHAPPPEVTVQPFSMNERREKPRRKLSRQNLVNRFTRRSNNPTTTTTTTISAGGNNHGGGPNPYTMKSQEARNLGNCSGPSQSSLQPVHGVYSETTDLATFLRTTGPPPDMTERQRPDDSGKFMRFLSRRKRV